MNAGPVLVIKKCMKRLLSGVLRLTFLKNNYKFRIKKQPEHSLCNLI